jgi:hypothetical protein
MPEDNDKPDLRVVNGGKTDAAKIPKELVQYMQIVAQQCAGLLVNMYPEVAATNPKRIENAANAAARDIQALQTMMAVFTPEGRDKYAKMRFALDRPSPIHGVPAGDPISFEPPIDLGQCTTVDDSIKCMTTLAFLLSDGARALAYFHGYRLKFGLYERAPAQPEPPKTA